MPLEKLLTRQGFSKEIMGINITEIDPKEHTGKNLSGINFDNIILNNCNFLLDIFF